jgi:hypothetical protein
MRILKGQPILKIKDAQANKKPRVTAINAQLAKFENTWFLITCIALLLRTNGVR